MENYLMAIGWMVGLCSVLAGLAWICDKLEARDNRRFAERRWWRVD